MARKHGRGRGISAGTIVMLSVTLLTVLVSLYVFTNISGDLEDITLDPNLLTEPLTVLTRSVGEIATAVQSSVSAGGGSGTSPEANDPVAVAPTAAATATPSPSPAPTVEPTQPPSRRLQITAAGQVSVGEELRKSGSSSFYPIFEPLAGAISGSDLAIVTLRGGLTNNAEAYDAYRAPASLASGLSQAGFTMINLATDRVLDSGTAGVAETVSILDGLGISAQGAYSNSQLRQSIPMMEINGIKVAVLSYTNAISSNGKNAASEYEIEGATRLLNLEDAKTDIAAAKRAGSDIVIVLAHWGSRSDTKASNETRNTASALAEAGADIILGTNPTTVQEFDRITVVDGNGSGREVFVAYSLGNFLIDDSRDTNQITGVMLGLTVDWDTQTQRASISASWYMPTWIMRYKDDSGVNQYRLVPSGTASMPSGMTETIYANMKKAYQSMVRTLGETYAQPRGD